MATLFRPLSWLGWLGRQGPRAVAGLVFLGVALPPVDRLLKPYVTASVFVLLCMSFLSLDPEAIRGHLRRPAIVALATAWTMCAIPLAFGTLCRLVGVDSTHPDLFLGLMLQAIASPMMAAPSLAALMGLDATLVLAALVAGTALMPLTAPLIAHVFLGAALEISPAALGWKLLLILGGSAAVGMLARRVIGAQPIARHKDEINGINILALYVFVAAVMETVGQTALARPLETLGLVALAFAIFAALLLVTAIVFAGARRETAMAVAVLTSQRNMGLMIAATGGILPEATWFYFALCQFPIYLSPLLLRPLVLRLR